MKLDVWYTIHYMLDYDVGVPKMFVVGISAAVLGMIVVLFLTRTSFLGFAKNASWCMLAGYVLLVLSVTLLFRERLESPHYYLCPLWSYMVLYERMLAELVLNVIMFVPIGFFASAAMKRRRLITVLCFGAGLSLAIEITQLLSMRGVCNVDDFIHNVFGCAIGFSCFVFCYKIVKKLA